MTPLMLVLVAVCAETAPTSRPQDLGAFIDTFLDTLYEKVQVQVDPEEEMLGDQPPEQIGLGDNFTGDPANDYFRTSRSRARDADHDGRAKDNWIKVLKENILRQIGRSNSTTKFDPPSAMNFTINGLNDTFDDDHITEKIRSYYPSCDAPANMEQDLWKDENLMNLHFNDFDQTDEKGMSIATATLRLYRIPTENSTKTKSPDCDSSATSEEERLLRVSIYWYTRSVRKKKMKRRLADSKVIQENAKWVELSVRPAARAWSKGKNLGLAVLVEDQEGNVLKADKFFKGALCMVGASTPKPIPTIIIDAVRKSNELDERIHSLLGRNSTSPLSGDIPMLPTIDVCTLEFPENYSQPPTLANLRTNACNLRKSHERAQQLAERDRLERLATLPEQLSPRHIRHQRQHFKVAADFDPRSKMVNKRILTNEELQALNLNITLDR